MPSRSMLKPALLLMLLGLPAVASASEAEGPHRGRPVVLVANAEGGTVSILDARSFKTLREIDVIPDPTDPTSSHGAVSALVGENVAQDQDLSNDGRTLFVSRGHRADVAAFDVASGELRWRAAIPGFRSDHMAISPDGRTLAVSALSADELVLLDADTGATIGRAPTGQWPHDNHFSPDGRRIYNGSIGMVIAPEESRGDSPYQLTVIDAADQSVLRSFAFERGIRPYVITHDETRMFAQLSEFSGLVEIDLRTGQIVRRLELPVDEGVTEDDYDFEAPHHGLAMTGDERTLCAAGRISDYVALVDTGSLTADAIIDVGDGPGWATTDPLGRYCFVTNTREDTVSVISYAKRKEVVRVKVGDGPKQMQAARIPETVLCSAPTVPGCSGRMRLVSRCAAGRPRVALTGDLDAVTRVIFRAAGKRRSVDRAAPYAWRPSAAAARRLRGRVVRAQIRTTGASLVRRTEIAACP